MPIILDDDGYETEEFDCHCCERRLPTHRADPDILDEDGAYVCDDCAPNYIDEVSFDIAKQERFYV